MLTAATLPPRFPLTVGATPLHRARRLEAALKSPPLYVKRDDLTGFALAGNKARKLELLVADALRLDADMLVTGGGIDSNHVQATAAAARVAGLACTLVLYGDPPAQEPPNLELTRRFGAEVHFTGSDDRGTVDTGIQQAAEVARSAGRRPYVIPRGGASPLGSAAYALATREVAEQLAREGVTAVTVVVATGSCGTQGGLVAGAAGLGVPWHVIGASVSRPIDECRQRVHDLALASGGMLGLPTVQVAAIDVRDARGAGYAQPSAEGTAAARLAAFHEGLLLDPVYTAKALGQLQKEITDGLDGPIVFWHTGGLAAALGDHDTWGRPKSERSSSSTVASRDGAGLR